MPTPFKIDLLLSGKVFVLNGIIQDIESAYKFGKLALSLVEQFNVLELKISVFFVAGSCTMHGKIHAKETLPILQDAYSSGLENGQFEYGCYATSQKCLHLYFKGLNLGAVDYITKPLQHEEFLARIELHLRLPNLTKILQEQNLRLEMEISERKLKEQKIREQAAFLDITIINVIAPFIINSRLPACSPASVTIFNRNSVLLSI